MENRRGEGRGERKIRLKGGLAKRRGGGERNKAGGRGDAGKGEQLCQGDG